MKIIVLIFGLIIVFAAECFGQTVNAGKLRFQGVGLDSTYRQVLNAFGKPLKDSKPTDEECAGGREKQVAFAGISFLFMDAPSTDRKTFLVMGFEVSSPKYTISGIKIGDDQKMVRRLLGDKFTKNVDESSAATVWAYEFPDHNSPGLTNIHFVRGKVVKIISNYTVC